MFTSNYEFILSVLKYIKFSLIFQAIFAIENPVVQTNYGPVRGNVRMTDIGKGFYSFLHIPYVNQPKGEFRFRDPIPVKPWNETLDCTREGPSCFTFERKKIGGSDECLGINVFTPNLSPGELLPVFVWIHGGAFVGGSSSQLAYGPDYIVEKDVILVSMNYRLNIIGFLSLKDPKVGVPGNAGLKDQTMALKWIKENIMHFGGDPNKITLAGESAGGSSVHYHMISPLSKGLFNRAIVMSGTAFNPWAVATKNYDRYFKKFLISLGLNGTEDDQLIFNKINETPSKRLMELNAQLLDLKDMLFDTQLESIFLPQVEPYESEMTFLSKPALELGRDPWSKDIDAIFGGNANEGLLFYAFTPMTNELGMINKDNSLLLLPELRNKLNADEAQAKGKVLKELYFKNRTVNDQTLPNFMDYSTDAKFWHGIYRAFMQRPMGDGQGKTYIYRLNVEPSHDVPIPYKLLRKVNKIPHMKGMAHGEDIFLLFKTLIGRRLKPGNDNYVAQQEFLNHLMNFTKYGNVSSNWPALSGEDKNSIQSMEINRTGSTSI
uniref:Carboxylic ester hydrolase n=1 Tax=Culicoides sonorensis TaxID=179676 RepID=A0A336LXX1_CULSO